MLEEDTYNLAKLRIRVQLHQSPGYFGSSGMVVGFCEDVHRATKSNLQMVGLQLAVSEIDSELQVSALVVGVFLDYSPTLEFNHNSKKIFFRRCHQVPPL